MQFLNTAMVGLLASFVVAHPGPHARESGASVMRRANLSKRCASAVGAMNEKRYNKRNLAKRGLVARANSTVTITTEAPCKCSPQLTCHLKAH